MKLAVIGGSGLYQIPGLCDVQRHAVSTPYGAPSDVILSGRLGDTEVLFLPRHGVGHHIAPGELNARANICALKQLGATQLLSVSAVGSLREDIAPGQVLLPDQFIDLTRGRPSSFFGEGVVAHVGFADPTCAALRTAAADATRSAGLVTHPGGTYVCIEGPQFSTRAESHWYRSFGAAVIGMTALPEARLAREAQLPYALLAFVTDYDCWHESEADVDVAQVLAVLRDNAEAAQKSIAALVPNLPDPTHSPAYRALENALITAPSAMAPSKRAELSWLLGDAAP